jgi:hypothetical protein
MNLARVFRGKWFDAMKRVGLSVKETLPEEWVVNCKAVGGGEKALIYLGLAEKPKSIAPQLIPGSISR